MVTKGLCCWGSALLIHVVSEVCKVCMSSAVWWKDVAAAGEQGLTVEVGQVRCDYPELEEGDSREIVGLQGG